MNKIKACTEAIAAEAIKAYTEAIAAAKNGVFMGL